MADPIRFGRSERQYSGVSDIDRGLNYRGDRVDRRFGPSEKQYTERRYTPSGAGLSWGDTGEMRRKIPGPGYDFGARPPRGLASLISRRGSIGQDPRSSTYQDPHWGSTFGSPDDLRGYRASVADVAAANAEEERNRLNEIRRYALTSPGSGIGLETQELNLPPGMNEYMGVEDWFKAVPKDPRDIGTMSEYMYDIYGGPWYRDTSDMRDYRQSWDPQMNEQTKLNLDLLADLDRGGTDEYRFANTAPVSIGERESGDVDWLDGIEGVKPFFPRTYDPSLTLTTPYLDKFQSGGWFPGAGRDESGYLPGHNAIKSMGMVPQGRETYSEEGPRSPGFGGAGVDVGRPRSYPYASIGDDPVWKDAYHRKGGVKEMIRSQMPWDQPEYRRADKNFGLRQYHPDFMEEQLRAGLHGPGRPQSYPGMQNPRVKSRMEMLLEPQDEEMLTGIGGLGVEDGYQQMTELSEDQMNLMRAPLNQPDMPGGLTKEQLWNEVQENPYEGTPWWQGGSKAPWGNPPQEDVTREEYDDYYRRLLEGEGGYWQT